MIMERSYNELGLVDPEKLRGLKESAQRDNVLVKIRESKDGSMSLIGNTEKVGWLPHSVAEESIGKPTEAAIEKTLSTSGNTWDEYIQKTELTHKYYNDEDYKKYVDVHTNEINRKNAMNDVNIGTPDRFEGKFAVFNAKVMHTDAKGSIKEVLDVPIKVPMKSLTKTPDGSYTIPKFALYKDVNKGIQMASGENYAKRDSVFVVSDGLQNTESGQKNEIVGRNLTQRLRSQMEVGCPYATSPLAEAKKPEVHREFQSLQQKKTQTLNQKIDKKQTRAI